MNVQKVGIIGCGLMGSGIAEQSIRCGFEVVVRELNDELLQKGEERIMRSMQRALKRGKITEEAFDSALTRLSFTTQVTDLGSCDLIIEAATEKMAIKKKIFAELDQIAKADTLLATNTSSLSITEIAAATQRAEKVLGIHFFNPVPVMPLIEYVRGLQTSHETMQIARAFGAALGKQTIESKDRPGFVVNRLLIPYLLDAINVLEEGVASKEDIDSGIKLGLAHPMGPLTLADFVGLDTLLFIADAMYDEFKHTRYAAPPLLRRMVSAGHYGRKSGQGFYPY